MLYQSMSITPRMDAAGTKNKIMGYAFHLFNNIYADMFTVGGCIYLSVMSYDLALEIKSSLNIQDDILNLEGRSRQYCGASGFAIVLSKDKRFTKQYVKSIGNLLQRIFATKDQARQNRQSSSLQ